MKPYLVVLLIILLASCNSNSPEKKYGLDFNKNRLELGLPALQPDWKLVKNDQNVLRWAPEGNLTGVGFIHKQVTIKDDKIYGEENRFEGAKKYRRDGVDYNEEVYISCYFDEKGQISEWGCMFKGARNPINGSPSEEDTKITLKQADSIITSWGIKY
jgi:hypothetical protein